MDKTKNFHEAGYLKVLSGIRNQDPVFMAHMKDIVWDDYTFDIQTQILEQHGFLFELFPEDKSAYNQVKDFSSRCLQQMISLGYKPWCDPDIYLDFCTESCRQAFSDFCQVLKTNPEHQALMFVSFLQSGTFLFKGRGEQFLNLKSSCVLVDDKTLLEHLWQQFARYQGGASQNSEWTKQAIKAGRQLEGYGFDFVKHGPDALKHIEQALRQPWVVKESLNLLHAYKQDFVAQYEKSLLEQSLRGKKTTLGFGATKKM